MKKLLGLVAAAVLPLACGSVPTDPTPALTGAPSSEGATLSSASRGVPACSDTADWRLVHGLLVRVAARGSGSVTVRADLVLRDDAVVPPCYTATFSVTPSGRGIEIVAARDGRAATLRAPAGKYLVTAVVGSQRPAHTAEAVVEVLTGK